MVSQFSDSEKQKELAGMDEAIEPEEVTAARDDLLALDQEHDRTEKLKSSVMKELDNAKDRAARVEEVSNQMQIYLDNLYQTTASHHKSVLFIIFAVITTENQHSRTAGNHKLAV